MNDWKTPARRPLPLGLWCCPLERGAAACAWVGAGDLGRHRRRLGVRDVDAGQCNVPSGLAGDRDRGQLYHSLALRSDGSVVAWAAASSAPTSASAASDGLSGVTTAAGRYHSPALRSDGSVVARGCVGVVADHGQCSVPSGLSGVIAIAAGGFTAWR
jgi:hypothetical protein